MRAWNVLLLGATRAIHAIYHDKVIDTAKHTYLAPIMNDDTAIDGRRRIENIVRIEEDKHMMMDDDDNDTVDMFGL
jgi:hypothetical protein